MAAKKNNFTPYFILLLILFAAYLPVSTFHFALKNDAFSDNFPGKYFMSAAIHAGIMPQWNPYMNFGFPMYADMGFAYWNPLTWLFALVGYNAYTLNFEVLLYIYLAGIFFYRLCTHFQFNISVSLTAASVYMCSGFFSGSITFINFLTAAAFLPCLLQSFLQLMKEPVLKHSIVFAFSAYMVFAGGHPAIPIAVVYFLLLLFIFKLVFFAEYKDEFWKKAGYIFLSFLFFLLLAAPAIYSYINISETYKRYTLSENIHPLPTGFDVSSYVSFLFPFSTAARHSFFSNDISMRNGYFSLLGIVACAVSLLQRNKLSIAFFLTGVCMLLLSISKTNAWAPSNYLPLLKYVTTNGEFRVFAILCFGISAGMGLQSLIISGINKNLLRLLLKILLGISAFIIIWLLIWNSDFMNDVSSILQLQSDVSGKIKWLLDNGSFGTFLFADALIAIIVTSLSLFLLARNKYKLLLYCVIADVALHCCLYLPVTGIGQVTLKEVQAKYDANPRGIPVPPLTAVNAIDSFDAATTGLLGSKSYYNKMIGTTSLTDYPSYFAATDSFFHSTIKDSVLKMPYLFLKNHHNNNNVSLKVNAFDASAISITAYTPVSDTIVLFQNYYQFWKAECNGKEVPVYKTYISFIGVPVEKGNNEIKIYYSDKPVIYLIIISLLSFIVMLVILFRLQKKLP